MASTVVFPDGTRVTGAAIAARLEDTPDFGLYAYGHDLRRATRRGGVLNRLARRGLHGGSWEPPWEVEWLHWPDFGVPADSELAAASIVRAFERARAGERVEVRCYGGRGRTGTMLACMAALAGVPAEEAVDWVRRVYSARAVERDAQREWVSWFAEHVPIPDDPDPPERTARR